ncbi:hypothetical protein BXZ70DRAFT_1067547 [Cristinia sonorae]|uniref:DUF6534 domain-containing protein n=1 Tax=Cristinia sonorae TaxID=1940300 RepID=A0A8K0UGD5_9AGAR|nr:hypothetical protein BXZ70DRAFT_1067547 [Cristinia sonorae]
MTESDSVATAIVGSNALDPYLVTKSMILAHLVSWTLFGMLSVQVYVYYVLSPQDSWRFKGAVGLTYCLELTQLFLATYHSFHVLAIGFGNPLVLENSEEFWFHLSVLRGIVSTVYQTFCAWHVYSLIRWQWLLLVISSLSITQLCLSIWDSVTLLRFSRPTHSQVFPAGLCWLLSASLCNIIIACSLTYSHRLLSANKPATIVTRLVGKTTENGINVTIFSILELILFIAKGESFWYSIVLTATSKLYSNTLLAILNSRVHITGGRLSDLHTRDTSYMFSQRAQFSTHISQPQHGEMTPEISKVYPTGREIIS